jgi:hypothetical protein
MAHAHAPQVALWRRSALHTLQILVCRHQLLILEVELLVQAAAHRRHLRLEAQQLAAQSAVLLLALPLRHFTQRALLAPPVCPCAP